MKKLLLFVVVGLVMFGAGFGGGLFFGRSMAERDSAASEGKAVLNPGPTVSIGEFTSNLAGSGRHVISFTASLEAINNPKAVELLNSPGWLLRIKNEILLIVKDKVYEDLTSAEGALQFAEEIKRSLNAQLPEVKGEAPIVRVLFETFVLQ
ncbi:MAG: flagellar basal body-associated FliL family protein [Synergistaceae bacterium]|jgi:flagellar FliL protein|nr:flagellar basal body-associated FliL family protein [Synergistaceae bacterium]